MSGIKSLLANNQLSEWASWLISGPQPSARETLLFLERAFGHLPPARQQRIDRRLRNANSIDDFLFELLVYEVCYEFELDPVFEPNIGQKTPDLALNIAGQTFIADVFVTNRPEKTLTPHGLMDYKDCGEGAKKLADRVSEKVGKYSQLAAPLVLFVFGRGISGHELETGLYGASVNEVLSSNGVSVDCHEAWHVHGVFCPPGPEARHPTLSAVIGCDWFDTFTHDTPGRRLHCVVYHHWQPRVPLPMGAFGRFQDVIWRRNESGLFYPRICGEANLVMSTTSRDEPEWAPYSANSPW